MLKTSFHFVFSFQKFDFAVFLVWISPFWNLFFQLNFVGLRPFAESQLFLSLFMFSLAFPALSSRSSPPGSYDVKLWPCSPRHSERFGFGSGFSLLFRLGGSYWLSCPVTDSSLCLLRLSKPVHSGFSYFSPSFQESHLPSWSECQLGAVSLGPKECGQMSGGRVEFGPATRSRIRRAFGGDWVVTGPQLPAQHTVLCFPGRRQAASQPCSGGRSPDICSGSQDSLSTWLHFSDSGCSWDDRDTQWWRRQAGARPVDSSWHLTTLVCPPGRVHG